MKSILVSKIIQTEKETNCSLFNKKGNIYTFLNPVSYLTALKNKDIFAQFDGIFADGSILVLAIQLLYRKKVTRRSFDMTSIAPELLQYAEENKKSIYIVASKQDQVERAIKIFKEQYPNLIIAGYRNGYFSSEKEIKEEANKIVTRKVDFVIIGMGILAQESFLLKVKQIGFEGIGFTCGGFIHQTAKNEINYYPAWVNKMNLRFIYRMYKEKHTRKRYLQAAFLFPIRFMWEKIIG